MLISRSIHLDCKPTVKCDDMVPTQTTTIYWIYISEKYNNILWVTIYDRSSQACIFIMMMQVIPLILELMGKGNTKLELVYLPNGKYCAHPRMVYRLAIVMPPPPPILDDLKWISIAFLAISDQYSNFIFFILFTKWLPAAILDDRKSLLIAFLAISDQYATLILFTKWLPAAISHHFRSIRNFYIFVHKMAVCGHLGWPKIAFDHISRYFRSIRNFDFFLNFS